MMPLRFTQVNYDALNSRQKENYNYYKIAAILSEYGYVTMRLSDDWNFADFIAQHNDDGHVLRVQLKSRLTFAKKYEGKDLYIAFREGDDCYLYHHDQLMTAVSEVVSFKDTDSWRVEGIYHFPSPSARIAELLRQHRIPPVDSDS